MKFIIFVLSFVGIVMGAQRIPTESQTHGSNWISIFVPSRPEAPRLGDIKVLPGSRYTSSPTQTDSDDILNQLLLGVRVLDITVGPDQSLYETINILKDILEKFLQSSAPLEFVVLVLRMPTEGVHKDSVSFEADTTPGDIGRELHLFEGTASLNPGGNTPLLDLNTPVVALGRRVVLVTDIPALSQVAHLTLEQAFGTNGEGGIWQETSVLEKPIRGPTGPRCVVLPHEEWDEGKMNEALSQNGIEISNSQSMPDATGGHSPRKTSGSEQRGITPE